MDLGIFMRSRRRLLFWLLAPVVLMVIVAVFGVWYADRVEGSIQWRRGFLQVAPELRVTANAAREVTRKSFLVFRSSEEARERLNGLINEQARTAGFNVNSMAIDEVPPASGTLRIAVRGDGTLASVMKFGNEVQRPEHLLSLDSCTMLLLRRQSGLWYTADFTFRYAARKP